MLDTHFPGSVPAAEVEPDRRDDLQMEVDDVNEIVTVNKIEKAINSFQSFKSPGKDMIYPIMMQRGGLVLVNILTILFRASLRLCHVPLCWTEARVVFLPKPGKGTYQVAKSFRPITLTSFFLKTLERLVYWHLHTGGCDMTRLGHPTQFAYKQGYSTDAALHAIVSRIEKAVYNKQMALGLFLDIEGAFSNVTFPAIKTALHGAGVGRSLTEWMVRMLKSQRITAALGECTRTIQVTRGTPQGGVLSPLLFNLVMNNLLRKLGEVPGIYAQAYADDVVILATGLESLTLSGRIQDGISAVADWSQTCGLKISTEKTTAVMFTWRRKWIYHAPRYAGAAIQLVKNVTYLGVTLDSKLSWIPHITNRTTKANRCLAMCRRAVGTQWGLAPKVMLWVYKTLIRPVISYATTVWCPGLDKHTAILKLTQLQRRACLAITSAYPGTPTKALEMLLGLPRLDLFLRGEAAMGAYRLQRMELWNGSYIQDTLAHRSHVNWCKGALTNLEGARLPGDLICPWLNLKVDFVTCIDPAESDGDSDALTCFTDGSKKETGEAGVGVHFPGAVSADISGSLGRYSTVFQAEVLAIILAAERLINICGQSFTDRVIIYSDSQAAIKATAGLRVKSALVRQCVDTLNSLAALTNVRLQWTKAHVGTVGNETADWLAKQGTQSPCLGPEPIIPVSANYCKQEVKRWLEKVTHTEWVNLTTCRMTRLLFAAPIIRKGTAKLLTLARSKLRLVLQVITGHGNFGSHLKNTGRVADGTCKRCNLGEETREHIVEDCPCYMRSRMWELGDHRPDLLSIVQALKFGQLAEFLVASGRLEDYES
jgi:ribonuclease HI